MMERPVPMLERKHPVLSILLYAVNILLMIWCCGAIWFQRWITVSWLKIILIAAYVLLCLTLLIFSGRKKFFPFAALAVSLLVMISWLIFLQPTGIRDWRDSCARIPGAVFSPDGNEVTISNIRDFVYRSETDYGIRYRTETYKLNDLETVDYAVVHWDNMELIAHVIFSFGFKDGRRLALSIETRSGKNDSYSVLAGIYRQYELIYILATEDDVLKLRTNYRHEDVYLYPMQVNSEKLREYFVILVKRASGLGKKPEFYNTLFRNCRGALMNDLKINRSWWNAVLNLAGGISDRAAFRCGLLKVGSDTDGFDSYKQLHYANQYVSHLDERDLKNYSVLIRPELRTKQKKKLKEPAVYRPVE